MSIRHRRALVTPAVCAVLLCAAPADAQPVANDFAVRVDGGQNAHYEDQFYLVCDDAVPGANSAACDVGTGDFSYELWIRAEAASNSNSSRGPYGPDSEVFAYDWIDGNIFLDRDVWGGSCDGRDFGAAILDGRVGFGTGGGPSGFTLYGSTPVTDGLWHHVALVREAGVALRIYVDGVLDVESAQYAQSDDLSIPDAGCTQGSAIGPEHQPVLVVGQEKHGLGGISLTGDFDELRIWASARSGAEIASTWNRVVDCGDDPALVGYYRFEAGTGTVAGDLCQRSPDGVVDNGTAGRGEWISDAPLLVPEPHAVLLGVAVVAALGRLGRSRRSRRRAPPARGTAVAAPALGDIVWAREDDP